MFLASRDDWGLRVRSSAGVTTKTWHVSCVPWVEGLHPRKGTHRYKMKKKKRENPRRVTVDSLMTDDGSKQKRNLNPALGQELYQHTDWVGVIFLISTSNCGVEGVGIERESERSVSQRADTISAVDIFIFLSLRHHFHTTYCCCRRDCRAFAISAAAYV